MIGTILVCLSLLLSSLTVEAIRKCCDTNEHLIKTNASTSFRCSEKSLREQMSTFLLLNSSIGIPPSCQSGETCIDKTDTGDLISLLCETEVNRNEVLEVLDVLKCCPVDMIYDYRRKKCKSARGTARKFFGILPDFQMINVAVSFPKCNGPVLDYPIRYDEIDFGKDLVSFYDRLTNSNKSIPLDEACFDDYNGEEMAVRVCEDMSVCDVKTCVRKCCKNGQVYVNRKCVALWEESFDLENDTDILNERIGNYYLLLESFCRTYF